MTSTTGRADTAQHPDVSEISDLAEGILSPSRTADVRRHLDGCALCADVQASLDEIRGLLGTLPGPHRMPADVAGRIDAALAAEALLDSTAPEGSAHVSRETAPAPHAAESAPADRPAGRPHATTGPGRDGKAKRRRRTAVLGAVLGTAALGMGALLLQTLQSPDGTDSSADRGVSATKQTGPTFSKTALEDRVQGLIAKQPMTQGEKTENGPSMDIESHTPLRETDVPVPQCVQDGTGRNTVPIAAQEGTYNGKKAFLLVLPHATDVTRVQAYIVDAACEGAAPPAKGEILLTQAYPRR
ncbi:zf-HC2 domain-containing protein [Streptomyces sp. ISL-96]|uniref:zf-HC2 domain-containing protein n=1 Tax=Streptomyces sp. ISL-96 TaxID=2819191 RepID=UPI001BECC4BD|nr:zf-HC2 domain-containing protein [Streptomyces sp. ISL-96]MBT2490531.1 zf-HC2 domain-containing protein [Streptomyces sp. ISL-96]